MICGILFDEEPGVRDECGCHLQSGHTSPHEFVATNGRTYQWETDLECDCEHCREVEKYGDGDYCTVYWQKNQAPAQEPGEQKAQSSAKGGDAVGGAS